MSRVSNESIQRLGLPKVLGMSAVSMAFASALGYVLIADPFDLRNKNKLEQKLVIPTFSSQFWDSPTHYFQPGYKFDRINVNGMTLVHDARMYFYVVQSSDIVEKEYIETNKRNKKIRKTKKVVDFDSIVERLSKVTGLEYLNDEGEYHDRSNGKNKIRSFNVPENIKPGMLIPIPIKNSDRKLTDFQFAHYCNQAIEEMLKDANYGKKLSKLIKKIGKKALIHSMVAFARSETSEDYRKFSTSIGSTELHRREPAYKSFSFSYFHILMEKNGDGESDGPGLKARKKLNLTEGQIYHPKLGAKLFLAYWMEKTNGDLSKFLPITDDNCETTAQKYNGSKSYCSKLSANFGYVSELLGKI